ncbi:MAG: hypothetical protein C0417_02895 [Chlorobiaceae bacterium]|nr:hypothetical protein [Chlorobiaceae bacterium]
MQNKIITIILISLFIFPLLSLGQNKFQPVFDHSLMAERDYFSQNVSKPETSLRVLAVMVDFQTDNDSRTTGDGHFDLRDTSKKFLDAPPHNRSYFNQHLAFLKNYYEKVSDNVLNVSFELLDSIYRLPHEMKYYSPIKSSKNNVELGNLVNDTWKLVDSLAVASLHPIDYQQYNTFIIFHAGVGRDIDLASLYGYDPTPYDIPSLYINLKSMRTMFNDDNYAGIALDSGRFHVTSSMILPETETRDQVPFPLGINGLIIASIGSHLELPDLFNTINGSSAIGRFGLMDGQSIFSWNGAFPPEPCAWEKQYLGWIKPIEIKSSDSIFTFPAKSLTGSSDTTFKVNINSEEYFLIENRNRDANGDGAIVTMIVGGDTVRKRWLRDTSNFNAIDQDSLYGTIIDVDEFDWSLPGGVDSRTKTFYDGGILIWHIDENIINQNIASSTINADANKRGVNLMEADGSPDIGQSYDLLHPGSGSESGTALDFWFAGNSAPLRKYDTTGFTPTSYPSSNSNTGANSHIYINRFSERGPRMSARIKIGDEQISLLPQFPKSVGKNFKCNSITALGYDPGNQGLIVSANPPVDTSNFVYQSPAIYGWKFDGSSLITGVDSTPLPLSLQYLNARFTGKIAVHDFSRDLISDLVISVNSDVPGSYLLGWSLADTDLDNKLDSLFSPFFVAREISTSPVFSDSSIAYGTKNGSIYFVKSDGNITGAVSLNVFDSTEIVGLSLLSNNSFIALSAKGDVRKIYNNGTVSELKNYGHSLNAPAASAFLSANSYWADVVGQCIAFASKDGYLFVVDSLLNVLNGFPVATGGEINNSPAIGDVDGDNIKDIVVFSGSKIYAVNATGAYLDNFPITVSSQKPILTSPIIADVNGDGLVDIVAVTQEGIVVAYNSQGRMVNGFPLLSGPNSGSTPAVFYMDSLCLSCIDIGLAVGSDDGFVYAWKTGGMVTGLIAPPVMPWPQYLHDAQNTGMSAEVSAPISKSDNYLPAERAYNWPNPVTAADNFRTHFRFYVKENSSIHFKIIDPAGDLVNQFDTNGIGGIDNEFEWDASALQSGVYFVHIEAGGSSGSGYSIFKMAIVR